MRLVYGALAGLIIAGAAVAHEAKGPNGGAVQHSGPYHVELVARGKTVEVFMLDDAMKPLDPTGNRGLAILVVGGKPARIPLEPAGKDRMRGAAPSDITGSPKGAVQITLPSGSTIQTKF